MRRRERMHYHHQTVCRHRYLHRLAAYCHMFASYLVPIISHMRYSTLGTFACFRRCCHFYPDDEALTSGDKLSLSRLHSLFHPRLGFYNNLFLCQYHCSHRQNRDSGSRRLRPFQKIHWDLLPLDQTES